MTEDEMVNKVLDGLAETSDEGYRMFTTCEKEELIGYHMTLGQVIRNEFKLWEREWTPQIQDGIDYSPDHPDAVSMRVITKAWEVATNVH